VRIGHGYDVHKFAENRKCIIGGVEIPYEKGLLGHSDADVLLHAICDALLGAAALGDIGKHFPDNDNEFLNIDSRILLRKTVELIESKGYKVGNIDATIISEKPKMAPFISKMVENIAKDCKTDIGNINVKATTEEGLGFTGELLGISAHAVCIIE
jgi:2-C-methyl-D-erythritol 2,4-cyclodiphosphate synthase